MTCGGFVETSAVPFLITVNAIPKGFGEKQSPSLSAAYSCEGVVLVDLFPCVQEIPSPDKNRDRNDVFVLK